MPIDEMSFRCVHRHTAQTHPQCYKRYLEGGNPLENLQIGRPRHQRSAKILLLDIETLPGEYYLWNPKQEYAQPEMQIKDWSIACWAAKWLFDEEIMGEKVSATGAYNRDDKQILETIWKLMNEANIIVTQNGERFDFLKLNAKFIENCLPPPAEYKSVDTLRVANSTFGWTYKRLDELGKRLGIGSKIDMSFVNWKNCLTNDEQADAALDHMLTYCKRDIAPLLEDVYLAMLPYMKSHPNLNVYTEHDGDVCPKCESTQLTWNEKPYATPQGLWNSFRCSSCGATGRGTRKEHNIKKVGIK